MPLTSAATVGQQAVSTILKTSTATLSVALLTLIAVAASTAPACAVQDPPDGLAADFADATYLCRAVTDVT